jgi:hypothetical protein
MVQRPEPSTPSAAQTPAPGRSGRRSFACGCFVATVVLVAVFGFIMISLFSSPSEVWQRLTRPPAAEEQSGTPSLTPEQMRMVRGTRADVTITLTEEEMNDFLQEEEFDLPSGLSDPRVSFEEDHIAGSVRARVAFIPVRVELVIQPEVVEGNLELKIVEVKAGKVSLGNTFASSLEEALNAVIAQKFTEAQVRFKQVEMRDGELEATVELLPEEQDE